MEITGYRGGFGMAQRDISEKILEDYNDVFADIINVLLFQGKREVKPEELVHTKIRSQYKADDSCLHEQERDAAKIRIRENTKIAFYGIENQTDIDHDMPLRVMGYDGAVYRNQLLNQKDKDRYPVTTLVLYFGVRHWKNNYKLSQRISIWEQASKFSNNYKIHVFEIAYLTEGQINMFQSDFRIIADYFVKRRTGEAYQGNAQMIQHVDAVLKFMSVFAADKRFLELNLKEYEGRVNMCVILDKVEERGIQIGIKKVVENMLKNNFSEEMILKAVDITKEKLDEIKGSMK